MLKSFIDNFVDVYFHHYADFDGCLGRKQYWLAWLATVIIGLITGFIDGLLFSGDCSRYSRLLQVWPC